MDNFDKLYKVYIEAWLGFWLPRDVRAYLSKAWSESGYPSVVPKDRLFK